MNLSTMIEFAVKDGAWWLSDPDTPKGTELKETTSLLKDPEWDKAGRIHDWRNYIGCWRECWDELSIETRFALYHEARTKADQEQWD